MKEKNNVSTSMVVIVFLIFTVTMVFVSVLLTNKLTDTRNYFKKYNTIVNNALSDQLSYQKEKDKELEIIANNGGYTLNKPYVINNPYKINPLSSIIIFDTMKKESVSVSINGKFVGKDDKSIIHIIPVVGLYSNSLNIVTITSESGETSNIEISTNAYDEFAQDLNVKKITKKDDANLLLLGDLADGRGLLRGFNSLNKLNFIIDFDNIRGIGLVNNHIYVKYNSKRTVKTNDLRLEMDYLGRIYSISTSRDRVTTTTNLDLKYNDTVYSYIALENEYYKDNFIEKYEFNTIFDDIKYTDYEKIETVSLVNKLDDAKTYPDIFNVSLMGEYVGVDFGDKKVNLLAINKYNNYTYKYPIDGSKLLKMDREDDVSLYVEVDGEYYTLLTVLEN